MATERIKSVLGRNGKNAREGRFTQEQVAAGVGEGWTKSTVSSVESGRRALSIAELVLYARALGVSVGALLADDDNPGVPLVGDLTAAQVQLILTGDVVELPQVDEGVATMRAADLDRLVADRLGITVTEVREHAKRHYGGRTLHAERERQASTYADQRTGVRQDPAAEVRGGVEGVRRADHVGRPGGARQHHVPAPTQHPARRDGEGPEAAKRAALQADRADSPQMRGAITKKLVDDMSDYVAAVKRQQQRSDA